MPSVEYHGFFIERQRIHKTSDKLRAVQNAKTSDNVKELQSFFGLVIFYGRFLKDLAIVTHPLYHLLRKDLPWFWSADFKSACEKIKKEITSTDLLVHFQKGLPVKLVHDAFEVGVGAAKRILCPMDQRGP